MTTIAEDMRCDLLALPDQDREELALLLFDSLPSPEDGELIAELERRAKEMEDGRTPGIPIKEVFARLDARLARRR